MAISKKPVIKKEIKAKPAQKSVVKKEKISSTEGVNPKVLTAEGWKRSKIKELKNRS